MKIINIVLLGSLAFTVVCWFGVTTGAAAIQMDIESQASTRLTDQRFNGVDIEADGRNVTLRGLVPTNVARVDAERAVRELPGVMSVANWLGLMAPKSVVRARATPYQLSISFGQADAILTGLATSEASRTALLLTAAEKYGVGNVVDQIDVVSNTRHNWTDASRDIVDALALLSTAHAQFTDVEIVVTGQAETSRERDSVTTAIRSAVPYGVALDLNIILKGD